MGASKVPDRTNRTVSLCNISGAFRPLVCMAMGVGGCYNGANAGNPLLPGLRNSNGGERSYSAENWLRGILTAAGALNSLQTVSFAFIIPE
ncbi:hypothetical protein D3C76_1613990 [compost metagenome]